MTVVDLVRRRRDEHPASRRRGLATECVDEAAAARLAPMFKALGDPIRLRLAAMIASAAEVCVCELTPAFEVSGRTIQSPPEGVAGGRPG